jgi:hypothetical protein
MIVANLSRQHHRSLNFYSKIPWKCLYLFGVVSYYFIPSILLKRIVYMYLKLILLMFFIFPPQYDNFTPFVILMRRRHLDNPTFLCVCFPNGSY